MGHLFASNPAMPTPTTNVGTYTVSPDCSVTMSIGDPFSSNASQSTGSTSGDPSAAANPVTFEGLIASSGGADEIDLVPTGNAGIGALLTLTKTSQSSPCSNASLTGNYSLIGEGLLSSSSTSPGGTTSTGNSAFVSGVMSPLGTPFQLFGRTFADGAGNLLGLRHPRPHQPPLSELLRELTL